MLPNAPVGRMKSQAMLLSIAPSGAWFGTARSDTPPYAVCESGFAPAANVHPGTATGVMPCPAAPMKLSGPLAGGFARTFDSKPGLLRFKTCADAQVAPNAHANTAPNGSQHFIGNFSPRQ